MSCISNLDSDDDTCSIDTLALEKITQEEWTKEINQLKNLSKKVRSLHTSFLFYHKINTRQGQLCYNAWKIILKKVGGTPNEWRELGYHLGISDEDMDYIENSMKADKTETILRVHMQEDDATLDKVTDAFIKMKRYDILSALEEPLLSLSYCFFKDDSKSDAGYHSSYKDSVEKLVCPKNIPNELPPVLLSKYTPELRDLPEKSKKPSKEPKPKRPQELRNDKPKVLLTFTEDGHETAENVKTIFDNWNEDDIVVSTLMLNERKNEVLQNPESFIRFYLEQADYVVPIITEGYLKEIQAHRQNVPSSRDNLDHKYAHFIYTLMVNKYIFADGCLNRKVRSVIPENVDHNSVLMDLPFYPVLLPWTCETDIDIVFKEILKKEE